MKAIMKKMTPLVVTLSVTGLLAGCSLGMDKHQSLADQTPTTSESVVASSQSSLSSSSNETSIESTAANTTTSGTQTPETSSKTTKPAVVSGELVADNDQTTQQQSQLSTQASGSESKTATQASSTKPATSTVTSSAPATEQSSKSVQQISAQSSNEVADVSVTEAMAAFNQATQNAYKDNEFDVYTMQLNPTTVQIEVRRDNDDKTISNLVHLYQYHIDSGKLMVMDVVNATWEPVQPES
ncbi:MAG: hypothetical protein Q4A55_07445 [Aerococcus sp.]|nr:hypothetical protein [Aerococcus sp.]